MSTKARPSSGVTMRASWLDEHFALTSWHHLVRRSTGKVYTQDVKRVWIPGYNIQLSAQVIIFILTFRYDPRPNRIHRNGSSDPREWDADGNK